MRFTFGCTGASRRNRPMQCATKARHWTPVLETSAYREGRRRGDRGRQRSAERARSRRTRAMRLTKVRPSLQLTGAASLVKVRMRPRR
jgi:hypothetical protein